MKTPPEDHDLNRWLDGEMSPAEREQFGRRLEADPSLRAEVEVLERLRRDLHAHLPAEMPVPYADFFNSQIQVRIAQEEAAPALAPTRAGWFDWLRLPTLMAAAAAVAIAGMLIWQSPPSAGDRWVQSTYTPHAGIKAHAFHSDEADATVLMLDGVEAMPADRKIVGYHMESSEMATDVAAAMLRGSLPQELLTLTNNMHHQHRPLTAGLRE